MNFKKLIGSKRQVWNGTAKMTAGGLHKKDLRKVTKDGVTRIRSRKEKGKKLSKGAKNWINAVKKARKELTKEGVLTGDEGFLPISKKKSNKKGNALYKRAKKIYNN